MKKILMVLGVFLIGSACTACFGGTVPYSKVKVVQPRVVQRTFVMPTEECAAVVGTPAKVVYPRVVQRSVAVEPCAGEPIVDVDAFRAAKVKAVYPRAVHRSVVTPTGYEGDTLVEGYPPRTAKVKVVYPRVAQRTMGTPVCEQP